MAISVAMTKEVRLSEVPSIPLSVLPEDERALSPASLEEVCETYRKWQHFPDPVPLYVVLATVIANRMEEGDPVWLMILGGSSRGKTEVLGALSGLKFVRVVGSLTEASLLSGTPRKERAKGSVGGLLREIPVSGALIVVKDFGAIIAMPRDRRATVLQALRDVYDGRYTRDVGTGGGERLEWKGRLGFIGAATGSLDAHHSVITALGERWLTLRLQESGARESAIAALRHHATKQMREEMSDVVARYLLNFEPPRLVDLDPEMMSLLTALSMLAATARSPVERDTFSREIVLVPQTEGPARLARQFHKLASCLQSMGLDETTVRKTLFRIALDTVPSPRREAFEYLIGLNGDNLKTSLIAADLDLPSSTALRTLEDLHVLGLAEREKSGDAENAPWMWCASSEAAVLWTEASKANIQAKTSSPEMSHTWDEEIPF